MRLLKYASLFLPFCLLLFAPTLRADVSIPYLNTRVTDLTGTLTHEQQKSLETWLKDFEQKKGSQVSVLVVPTTQPETIEQYSIRVVEAWKLGRKGLDDGVLLLVAKNDRKVRIEVGYGLEGALTDVDSKRIIDSYITPQFRNGDFYQGIHLGLTNIMNLISGEELLPPPQIAWSSQGTTSTQDSSFILVMVGGIALYSLLQYFLSLVLSSSAAALATGFLGASLYSWGHGVFMGVFVFFITLISRLPSSGKNGTWSSSSSGSWSNSSSSSGGFRGGGGSFGGGGASGSW